MELYRYESPSFRTYGKEHKLELRKFKVVKETPKGYWIVEKYSYHEYFELDNEDKKRWVAKDALRSFAYDTKEKALKSFQFRKRSQIAILENQLENARKALNIANKQSDVEILAFSDGSKSIKLNPNFKFNKWDWHPWKNDFLTEEDTNL